MIRTKKLLILDFDGTLIKENSSRILERYLIANIRNTFIKKFLYIVFFGYFSKYIDILFNFISKLCKRRDIRRRIFFLITSFTKLKNDVRTIISYVCRNKLNINAKCINKINKFININSNEIIHIIILSAGIREIITEFLNSNKNIRNTIKRYKVKIIKVVATKVTIYEDKIKIALEITIPNKIRLLKYLLEKNKNGNTYYITDSYEEIKMIKRRGIKVKIIYIKN